MAESFRTFLCAASVIALCATVVLVAVRVVACRFLGGRPGRTAFAALAAAACIAYGGGKPHVKQEYTINFHRNDGTATAEARTFEYGVKTRLPSIASLAWARRGYDFVGWATSKESTAVWRENWAYVTTAASPGKTLNAYALWAVAGDSYEIRFERNDGAGTWRTVGFKYGEKTRMPTILSGLGWARRGLDFLGWSLSWENAESGVTWKDDWAIVAAPVARGETLVAYASWAVAEDSYAIRYNKCDGSGEWRTVGFKYGEKTRMPSLANGLGWRRAGYDFLGWSLTPGGEIWKGDWAYVATGIKRGTLRDAYAVWSEAGR